MKTRSLKRHVESVQKCSICEGLSSYKKKLKPLYQTSSQTDKNIHKSIEFVITAVKKRQVWKSLSKQFMRKKALTTYL